VQGIHLPVLRGPGEIGIPRRFWYFSRRKVHTPLSFKKEAGFRGKAPNGQNQGLKKIKK